jgi:hypothetical protein
MCGVNCTLEIDYLSEKAELTGPWTVSHFRSVAKCSRSVVQGLLVALRRPKHLDGDRVGVSPRIESDLGFTRNGTCFRIEHGLFTQSLAVRGKGMYAH